MATTDVAEKADYTVTISKEDFATTTIETNIDCPLDNCGNCQHKIKTTIPKTAPKCKGVSEFNITVEYDDESGNEVPLEGVTVKILLENSEDYEKATLITGPKGKPLETFDIMEDGLYKAYGLYSSVGDHSWP